MNPATIAALAAGGWAASAYLDAKFHIRNDLSSIRRLIRGSREFSRVVRQDRVSLWYVFEAQCRKRWNNRAIWSREGSYTYGETYDQACRYAQYMLQEGVKPRELVAMYMINSADFMFVWFGCLAIGAAPAFLNYNLQGEVLLHSLNVSQSRFMFVDKRGGCVERINDSRGEIEAQGTKIAVLDDHLKQVIGTMPTQKPPRATRKGVQGRDPFCLIYTSGTTGLPKGSAFAFERVYSGAAHDMPICGGIPGKDQWYNAMPLYHGTGGMMCAISLINGIAIALAPRFSVSRFWEDIYDSESTCFVYVGETARYLLNAPPHPLERKHKLRIAYGNGLRPDVWDRFQSRFGIPEVGEFFNSTEGMFALINHCKGPYMQSCVGHHGLIFRVLLRNYFIPVQIDYETGDVWRDPKTGFARRTSYDEGGEILVAVPDKTAFQGYWRAPSATNKKFCVDVFKKGDLYYRTGDALRRDDDGKWHFLDRLGDTFRWKSENVSTAEVALVMGHYPGIAEANVYGVLVPNHEGRAGCAAIQFAPGHSPTPESGDYYKNLVKYLRERLPRYAVPVFLRIVKASVHIHNHKQNKVPLRREGVDPKLVGTQGVDGKDDVFLWLPPSGNQYIPFSAGNWGALVDGQAKL